MSNEWVRTTAFGEILPEAGIAGTPLALITKHHPPASLGMLDLSTAPTRVRIPDLENIGIAVNNPTEVRFVDADGNELFGAEFDDEHPREWIDALAAQGRALLIIAPKGPAAYETFQDWLAEAWVGMVPTAIYAWADGVGITPGP